MPTPTAALPGAHNGGAADSQQRFGADAPPALELPPAILEYVPVGGERWRVEKFDLLAAELELQPPWAGQLEHLHELGLRHARQWLIARKVFGIAPMFIPDGEKPEDFQAQPRERVCVELGITAEELRAELDALRALWRDYITRECLETRMENPDPGPVEANGHGHSHSDEPPAPQSEIVFNEDILRKHGFDEGMFEAMVFDPQADEGKGADVPRSREKNQVEKEWFAGRVKAWDKMLTETRSEATAREALMNQLYLRRLASSMAVLSIRSSDFKDLSALKKSHEESLARQLKELGELFPELDQARHRPITLSDYNKALRDYYGGRKDRRLFDRVFTTQEREVLDRMSVQAPAPQFRFGQHTAIIEAIHHLYDPEFRTQLKPAELKLIDEGYKAGVVAWREKTGQPPVNLEEGVLPGEGSDYEDLLELAEPQMK